MMMADPGDVPNIPESYHTYICRLECPKGVFPVVRFVSPLSQLTADEAVDIARSLLCGDEPPYWGDFRSSLQILDDRDSP